MTGGALYRDCRKAGIDLAIDGDSITFDAPFDVAVPVDELRRIKPELLALLQGDYLHAAHALLIRLADPALQDDLACRFDERVSICVADGIDWGEAEKTAYREIAKRVDGGGDAGKSNPDPTHRPPPCRNFRDTVQQGGYPPQRKLTQSDRATVPAGVPDIFTPRKDP